MKGNTNRSNTLTVTALTSFDQVNTSSLTAFKVSDIATITGRFGITSGPQDRTLWYVKGGAAYVKGNVDVSAAADELVCVPVGCTDTTLAAGSVHQSYNRWGWTAGTGVEFGLWDRWSAKIEYDYMQFSSRTFTFTGLDDFRDPVNFSTTIKQNIQEAKVGLNYRFWGY